MPGGCAGSTRRSLANSPAERHQWCRRLSPRRSEMTITIDLLFDLVGFILAVTAVMTLMDRSTPRRYLSAVFWALSALVFLIGQRLPPEWVGAGVIVMALIAGFEGVGAGRHEMPSTAAFVASARRLGHKLFVPALAIPVLTMIGTLAAKSLVIG